MNPSHLYWGSKADNTYDQNRGNGWAAENKKSLKEDVNFKGDKIMKISRSKLRTIIKEAFSQMTMSDEELMNVAAEYSLGMDQTGEFISLVRSGMLVSDALASVMSDDSSEMDIYSYDNEMNPDYYGSDEF